MFDRWTSEQSLRHRESLLRELGEPVLRALQEEDVTEILLNADGELWADGSTGLRPLDTSLTPRAAESLIATVAGLLGRIVDTAHPILEGELPFDGSRFEALLPPVVAAPIFAIRKRPATVFPLERYVTDGILSAPQAEALRAAVAARRNLLVAGGPGSGKTTLVNTLIHEISQRGPEPERLCILEDTYELRCEAPNHVILHTSGAIGLVELVRAALRLRPDRLVIGEVRGAEALELLKAWNTGNPGGLATVHANSAREALVRLDQLAQEAGVPSQAALIASTVHLVAYLERSGPRRQLRQLAAVEGYSPRSGFRVRDLTQETAE